MSEWISVKDKLPDDYEYVLVYAKMSGHSEPCPISIARYEIRKWVFLAGEDDNAVACGDLTWDMDADHITHWMDLPNPPEDK